MMRFIQAKVNTILNCVGCDLVHRKKTQKSIAVMVIFISKKKTKSNI